MIALGIPTYNEADSIVQATHKIEQSILLYAKKVGVPPDEFVIVNADNNSPDGTGEKFLGTKTSVGKKLITTNDRGKGRNLLAVFRFAQKNGIQAVATIDADITTIRDNWVQKLLDPILQGQIDMTVPLYERNRFEGSTTNHFAFPVSYAYFGQVVRQPIGGEFGFSAKLIDYLVKQEIVDTTYRYGIDIFCTMNAIGGRYSVESVFLGKKWHKPSFSKIAPMFVEVANSALGVLAKYDLRDRAKDIAGIKSNITPESRRPEDKQVNELMQIVFKSHLDNKGRYRVWLPETVCHYLDQATENGITIDEHCWTDILTHSITATRKSTITSIDAAQMLMPMFIWRTITFWRQAEISSPEATEHLIHRQAKLLRDKLKMTI